MLPFRAKLDLSSYLKNIEAAFRKAVQDLIPSLERFEAYLANLTEDKDSAPGTAWKTASDQINQFYTATHPFLLLLKRCEQNSPVVDEKKKANVRLIMGMMPKEQADQKPFWFPEVPLVGRFRAIIALQGAVQDVLPLSFFKKISRKRDLETSGKTEQRLKQFLDRIEEKSVGIPNRIRIIHKGLKAIVEHFQKVHCVKGVNAASLGYLELALHDADFKRKKPCFDAIDETHVRWRNTLAPGSVLVFQGGTTTLAEPLKSKGEDKKEDRNLLFACKEFPDRLVLLVQNQAMLHIIPLIAKRNPGIPLFDIYEVEPKGRFALIERLYPLNSIQWKSQFKDSKDFLDPDDIKILDSMARTIDEKTLDGTQPSNLSVEGTMLSKDNRFKAITGGSIDYLNRKKLQQLAYTVASGNPAVYRYLCCKSKTLQELHTLCISLVKAALKLTKESVENICDRFEKSPLEDCQAFSKEVGAFQKNVHDAYLHQYGEAAASRCRTAIDQAIFQMCQDMDHMGQFSEDAKHYVLSRARIEQK